MSEKKKLVKKARGSYSEKKIPKHKFIAAINLARENDSNSFWVDRNICCSTYIHNAQDCKRFQDTDSQTLEILRSCLARRNWSDFIRSFETYKLTRRRSVNLYMPILVRYAAICLAHNNVDLAEKCLQIVLSETEDSNQIKRYTSLNDSA